MFKNREYKYNKSPELINQCRKPRQLQWVTLQYTIQYYKATCKRQHTEDLVYENNLFCDYEYNSRSWEDTCLENHFCSGCPASQHQWEERTT